MTVIARLLSVQEAALCLCRKWWRPATCVGIAGSLVVNGVVIPLMGGTAADLTGLAALVAALTPFVAARTFEKSREVAE